MEVVTSSKQSCWVVSDGLEKVLSYFASRTSDLLRLRFVLFCFVFFFLSSCCWVFLDHFIPSGGFETILRSWFSNIIDLISTVSWASLVEITPAEHRQSYTPHTYGRLMKQEPLQEYKTPRQSKLKAYNNLLNELQKSCTPVITSWNDQNIGNRFIYLFF